MNKKNIKKLDDLWSDSVKKKAGYKCEVCGKTTYLNSHHIYSRSNYSVRWDLENGVCLCSGCHTLKSDFSAHKTPLEFTEWLYNTKGKTLIDGLRFAKNQIVKHETDWIEGRIEYFKAIME